MERTALICLGSREVCSVALLHRSDAGAEDRFCSLVRPSDPEEPVKGLSAAPEELEAAPALREVWEEIRHTRNVTPEALAR